MSASEPKQKEAEPTFNAPDALARKTAEYSKQMQSMLESDPHGSAGPANQKQVTTQSQASRVQWGDNFDLRLNSASVSQQQQPHSALEPKPVDPTVQKASASIETTPGNANSVALIDTSASGSNLPANIPQPTAAPSTPAVAPSTPIGNSSELWQKLEKRIKEYPRDLSGHLDYQLLRFLLDDRVPDLAALSSLPTEDRELLASLIDGLINFRSAVRQDNNMLLSRKVRPLIEMADRLRGQADLTIPTIALCTSVRTFGDYQPIDPTTFAPQKAHDVILYCEVDNFSSQVDEKQMWQTKLTLEAVLYTETGIQVWSDKSQPINDVARHRRHDFFVVKKMRIPDSLAVGRYLMKVTIVDQQMSRVAEATVPITIAVP